MASKLYTLTEVSKRTGISMPTLQRYKKLYQDRIPSEGSGRTQRYPASSLAIFRQLKKENIGRRGRPRKNPVPPAKGAKADKPTKTRKTKKAPKKQAEKAASSDNLLTLTEVGKMTGISYPTLLRYVKMHLESIPHSGSGRGRRYHPDAVAVFKKLREESRRGRAPGKTTKKVSKRKPAGKKRAAKSEAVESGNDNAALTAQVKSLEKLVKQLQSQLVKLEKQSAKPLRITLQR